MLFFIFVLVVDLFFYDLEACKTNLQKPLAKQIMKVIPEPYEMDTVRGTIYWIFISDRSSLDSRKGR